MTNQTASDDRWVGGNFRVGRILDRTISTYRRSFLPFSVVTLAASAAPVLVAANGDSWANSPYPAGDPIVILVTAITAVVLALLSQTIIVHGAFQVLRNKPINLLESAKISLRRFFPILGLIILVVVALFLFVMGMTLIAAFATTGLGRYPTALLFVSPVAAVLASALILIFVTLMLIARWFVIIPICMVERFGPWRSLVRSARLTQGHRWRVVGIILMVIIPALIVDRVIGVAMTAIGGRTMQLIVSLLWYAVFSAFFAILVVVTYYELRSAKDGADIEQIATVFD